MKGKKLLTVAFSLLFLLPSLGQKPTTSLDALPDDPDELTEALQKLVPVRRVAFILAKRQKPNFISNGIRYKNDSTFLVERRSNSPFESELISTAEAVTVRNAADWEHYVRPSSLRNYWRKLLKCEKRRWAATTVCNFEYHASISREARFAVGKDSFEEVFVVFLRMSWFIKCGPSMCSSQSGGWKKVVFDRNGKLLALFEPSGFLDISS